MAAREEAIRMIVKMRLEAEAETLDEVYKDIEAATQVGKFRKELQICDEHYERAGGIFKGRRVLAIPAKFSKPPTNYTNFGVGATGVSAGNVTFTGGQ